MSVINKTGRGRKRKRMHVDSKDVPSKEQDDHQVAAAHQTPLERPLVVTHETNIPSSPGSGPVVIHSAQAVLGSELISETVGADSIKSHEADIHSVPIESDCTDSNKKSDSANFHREPTESDDVDSNEKSDEVNFHSVHIESDDVDSDKKSDNVNFHSKPIESYDVYPNKKSDEVYFHSVPLESDDVDSNKKSDSVNFHSEPLESDVDSNKKSDNDVNFKSEPIESDDVDSNNKSDIDVDFNRVPPKAAVEELDTSTSDDIKVQKEEEEEETGLATEKEYEEDQGVLYSLGDKHNGQFMILNVESTEKEIKRQISCNVCEVEFPERAALLEHRVTQHSVLATTDIGTTERRYPCDHCAKHFKSFARMVDHRRNHVERHQCGYCSRIYTRRNALNKHIAYKHEGVYKCKHCQDGFRTEAQFKIHVAEKNCQSQQQCNLCGKFYPSKTRLYEHIAYMHKDWIQCDICEKRVSKRFIKTHKEYHLGVRAFPCGVCGKRFITANGLRSHEKIHLKQRRFQCSICQVQFDLLSQAKVHARIHTGEKACVCDVCGEAFSRASGLKRHMAQHGGEKPHSCPECGKSFNEKSSCARHVRRHHPEMKPFSCFICKESFVTKQELDEHTVVHIDSGTELAKNDDPVLQVSIETIDTVVEEC